MLRAARIALSPQGLRLYSSEQYSVNLRRILVLPLDILQTYPGIAKIYPASLKSDTLPDMLSYLYVRLIEKVLQSTLMSTLQQL